MSLKNFNNNNDYQNVSMFHCSTPILKHCKNNSLERETFANCLNDLSVSSTNDMGYSFEVVTNSPKTLRQYIHIFKENAQQLQISKVRYMDLKKNA